MSNIIITKAKDYDGYFAMVNDPTKGFAIKMSMFDSHYVNQLHITEETKALAEQSIFAMLLTGELKIVDDPAYE